MIGHKIRKQEGIRNLNSFVLTKCISRNCLKHCWQSITYFKYNIGTVNFFTNIYIQMFSCNITDSSKQENIFTMYK